MSVFEVVSSGDRRSLIERFNRKSKQQAISELVDIHLMHCTRVESLEAQLKALTDQSSVEVEPAGIIGTHTKTKHTPGPYEVEEDITNSHGNLIGIYIRKRDNGMVGQVFANCLANKEQTVRANARLFAAAPDLLTALKKVTICLKDALTGQLSAKKAGNALVNAAETYEKATGEKL